MIKNNKPLLSYLLFTYNQEKYIREAIESAFAQTYSPLEIIISDDHSTDNTWEIIKELFNKYNGSHIIIINRNNNNLGIANHVNKVMSMAKGELFIMAAGDDISFSERTQVIYEHWYPRKDIILALTSSNISIDKDGKILPQNLYEQQENYIESNIFSSKPFNGAGSAYSSLLIKNYESLSGKVYEDLVYYRRALMSGSVYFIKQPLLKYRLGGLTTKKIVSYSDNLKKIIKSSETSLDCSKIYLQDYIHIGLKNKQLQNKLEKLHKLAYNRYKILHTNDYYTKLHYWFKLLKMLNKRIGFYRHEDIKPHQFLIISLSLLPIKSELAYNSIRTTHKLFSYIKSYIFNLFTQCKRL